MPVKKKTAPARKSAPGRKMIAALNVNVPGYTHSVDATMFEAMSKAMLKMLPRKSPGMTQTEMWKGLAAYAPKNLFPNRGMIGWWMKTVQLDLEARKVLVREQTKPLRWHRK